MFRHPFRTLLKLIGFLVICLAALLDYFRSIWLPGRVGDCRNRAQWSQHWAQRFLKLLNVTVDTVGVPPPQGLLVSNHLSYLDIVVLSAAQPMAFISKSEVRSWPLIGQLTKCAGTLYVNRARKADVMDLTPAFAPVINQGVVLALFPEGTSTAGDKVLPFLSSLLEPAVANGWQTSPAWIGYSLAEGSVADEICYWRDMTFFSHFLNLLSKKSIQAKVVYETAAPSGLNRKQLARVLHGQVCALARQHGHHPMPEPSASFFAAPKNAF